VINVGHLSRIAAGQLSSFSEIGDVTTAAMPSRLSAGRGSAMSCAADVRKGAAHLSHLLIGQAGIATAGLTVVLASFSTFRHHPADDE